MDDQPFRGETIDRSDPFCGSGVEQPCHWFDVATRPAESDAQSLMTL